MEPKDNDRLKDLVRELAQAINSIIIESKEIKNALKGIEEEGYSVDVILASIARISPKESVSKEEELIYEFNSFDMAFLKALKIKVEVDKAKE